MERFIKQLKEVELLEDVICDRCGKTCLVGGGYEYAILSANWGYESLKDGEQHRAQICEGCYDAVVKDMKINVQVGGGGLVS
jgi:hypothetical protein